MSTEIVKVGCRLPNGYVFHYPSENINEQMTGEKTYIDGQNKSVQVLGQHPDKKEIVLCESYYGVTDVPKDRWEQIEKMHKNNPVFTSRAIFSAKDEKSLKAMADEIIRSKTKTGFEAKSKETDGIKPFRRDDN